MGVGIQTGILAVNDQVSIPMPIPKSATKSIRLRKD